MPYVLSQFLTFRYLIQWAGISAPRWETRTSLAEWPDLMNRFDQRFSPIERVRSISSFCSLTFQWMAQYLHGLPAIGEPTIGALRRQFLEDGLTHMTEAIPKRDIFDLHQGIIEKFNTIMHTIRSKGKQQQLDGTS